MSLNVLLVEGWMAGSHEAWATGWQRHSRHRIRVVSQPGDHWQHRMVAGSLPLAVATSEQVDPADPPEVVVASDMVDLPSYLGLCASVGKAGGGVLAGVPTVLYLHENQLTQPTSPNGVGGSRSRHLAWTNWRSLVAADQVWSNSDWQLRTVSEGLGEMLGGAPDAEHHLALLDDVLDRCCVMPVGCDLSDLLASERTGAPGTPLVLWNHRWSHDKGLERAVTSMSTLVSEGIDFRVAVVGEDDHHDPDRGERILAPVADRIEHRGWMDRDAYRRLLTEADVVLACPRQENFGISVVEAVAAGCIPVVPDAFAFPETIDDPDLRHPPGRTTTRLREVLGDIGGHRAAAAGCRGRLARFDWPAVAATYDRALEQLVGASSPRRSGPEQVETT